jgi:hypothetical protein
MRRLFAAFTVATAHALAAPAAGEPVQFSGRIELGFGLQEPFTIPALAGVVAERASNGAVEAYPITYPRPNAAKLTPNDGGIVLWPAVFETFGMKLTPPEPLGNGLIGGVEISGWNGTGVFAPDPARGNKLRGVMPFRGITRLCLFADCWNAPAFLTITADGVVGAGGRRVIQEEYGVNLTVIGAPWTSGTVAIGTMTQRGGPTPEGGVSLVTPVFIRSNIPAIANLATFWRIVLRTD